MLSEIVFDSGGDEGAVDTVAMVDAAVAVVTDVCVVNDFDRDMFTVVGVELLLTVVAAVDPFVDDVEEDFDFRGEF